MDKLKVTGSSLMETTVAMTILIIVLAAFMILGVKVNNHNSSKQIRAHQLIDSISHEMCTKEPVNEMFTISDLTISSNIRSVINPHCMLFEFTVNSDKVEIRSETRILKLNIQ